MTTSEGDWERCGRALHRAMAEVLEEFPEEPNLLRGVHARHRRRAEISPRP